MGPTRMLSMMLASVLIAPALAQQPPVPGQEPPASARLPAPDLDENAPASAFLQAAKAAIAADRIGEAQEALERAESRVLVRSVRPSMAGTPSRQPLVARIASARAALQANDRMRALQLIDGAVQAETKEPD